MPKLAITKITVDHRGIGNGPPRAGTVWYSDGHCYFWSHYDMTGLKLSAERQRFGINERFAFSPRDERRKTLESALNGNGPVLEEAKPFVVKT